MRFRDAAFHLLARRAGSDLTLEELYETLMVEHAGRFQPDLPGNRHGLQSLLVDPRVEVYSRTKPPGMGPERTGVFVRLTDTGRHLRGGRLVSWVDESEPKVLCFGVDTGPVGAGCRSVWHDGSAVTLPEGALTVL